ncbi:hypothetical protein OIU76_021731 [Salix suchowensis]|nr:hypothetical protein OIU76_021731 [Salix suchowensis]
MCLSCMYTYKSRVFADQNKVYYKLQIIAVLEHHSSTSFINERALVFVILSISCNKRIYLCIVVEGISTTQLKQEGSSLLFMVLYCIFIPGIIGSCTIHRDHRSANVSDSQEKTQMHTARKLESSLCFFFFFYHKPVYH